jgi:hypothetical protein
MLLRYFVHHLFEVVVRKLVSAILLDGQKDGRGLEAPPLEQVFILFHE